MHIKKIAVFSALAVLAVATYAQEVDSEYDADVYSDENAFLVHENERRLNPPGVYPNAGDPNYTPKKTHTPSPDPARFKGKSPPGVYANAGPAHASKSKVPAGGFHVTNPDPPVVLKHTGSPKAQREGHHTLQARHEKGRHHSPGPWFFRSVLSQGSVNAAPAERTRADHRAPAETQHLPGKGGKL